MLPRTVTVGREVIGLVAMLDVGHRTRASTACGCAVHSHYGFLTMLRRPHGRAA
jgi:hypothetical protein